MIALQKKPKLQNAATIAHTPKIVARILRRRIERKITGVLGEDQFEFRRGRGTRDAIVMLRIILQGTLDIDEELCACFIDWQKAFGYVNWTKLMQILKGTGIDWHERRLIRKLCMDQSVKLKLEQVEMRSVKIGRGVIQECCLSQILFNLLYS
jgi:hypothetical protein